MCESHRCPMTGMQWGKVQIGYTSLLKINRSQVHQAASECLTVSFQLESMSWIIMIKLMSWHNKLCNHFQLCGKQTGFCRQISKVDKIYKNTFSSECTKQQWNKTHFKVNLSSSIECALLSPTLIFAWSFYDIFWQVFLNLHSLRVEFIVTFVPGIYYGPSFQVHLEVVTIELACFHCCFRSKTLQNSQSLQSFCLWGCKEAAL